MEREGEKGQERWGVGIGRRGREEGVKGSVWEGKEEEKEGRERGRV